MLRTLLTVTTSQVDDIEFAHDLKLHLRSLINQTNNQKSEHMDIGGLVCF